MIKCGFFNARNIGGNYDRKYNADDYSSLFASFIQNGVRKGDLSATAAGANVIVSAGFGIINGHWFNNTAPVLFPVSTPSAGQGRYDMIVARLTAADRIITINYVTGTPSANPVRTPLTRSDGVYEICLCEIDFEVGADFLLTDTRPDREKCGWATASDDYKPPFTYECTGVNDNKALSQIAQAIYDGVYDADEILPSAKQFLTDNGGSDFFANLDDNTQITIKVVGECVLTSPFETVNSKNIYFKFGKDDEQPKRVAFDFSNCTQIYASFSTAQTAVIFGGYDFSVKNAKINIHGGTGVNVEICNDERGKIEVKNCEIYAETDGYAIFAFHGFFKNNTVKLLSQSNAAKCFELGDIALIRVIGGIYGAYVPSGNSNIAVLLNCKGHTDSFSKSAFAGNNIYCPELWNGGAMKKAVRVYNPAYSDYVNITDLICDLPSDTTMPDIHITNQIPLTF